MERRTVAPASHENYHRNRIYPKYPLILGLLAGMFTMGWLGLSDLSGALSFLGRLTGALMIIAALLMLIGAVACFWHFGDQSGPKTLPNQAASESESGPNEDGSKEVSNYGHASAVAAAGVLLGALSVLVAGLMMLAVQAQGGEFTPYLIIWLLLTAWACWALWVLLHNEELWRRLGSARAFKIGIAIAGAVSLVNFAYSQIYQPYAAQEEASASVTFGTPVARPGGGTLVPTFLSIKNNGNVGLYIAHSQYTAYEDEVAPTQAGIYHMEKAAQLNEEVHANFDLASESMIETGQIAGAGSWLNPGSTDEVEKIIEVPKGISYEFLTVSASAVIAREDRVGLDIPAIHYSWNTESLAPLKGRYAPEWVVNQQGIPYVRYTYSIAPSNAVLKYTRQPKSLSVWWVLDPRGAGVDWAVFDVGHQPEKPTNSERASWVKRYGLEYTSSGSRELPIAQLPGQ